MPRLDGDELLQAVLQAEDALGELAAFLRLHEQAVDGVAEPLVIAETWRSREFAAVPNVRHSPFVQLRNVEADLARILAARGIDLHRRGETLVGACPMHDAGTRVVLTVALTTNTWTCPACTPEPSLAIDFVMKIDGVSRRHAIELLSAGTLFLSDRGERLGLEWMTQRFQRVLGAAKIGKNGACHIFLLAVA